MRLALRTTIMAGVLAAGGLLTAACVGPAALAGDAGVPGPHGGTLERTKAYQFEVVFTADGVTLYPFGADGKPLDAARMTGTATFYHPNSPRPWFDRPLRSAEAGTGRPSSSLDLSIRLGNPPPAGAKVAFEIAGLPDTAEPTASFTTPLTRPAVPASAARPTPAPMTYARATPADRAAIAAQRACKVSGEPLGSMGGPIKVARGNRATYLCCMGCLRKVQADPDKYLGEPAAESATRGRQQH